MNLGAENVEDYLQKVPLERQEAFNKLRKTILDNLPTGYEETMSYGMIGYVVPKSNYPDGYHCSPELPLPFMSIASQKNFVAFYHMGMYADAKILDWFVSSYQAVAKYKLDMGKSCVRFKKMDDIPYELIGQLTAKISCDEWIAMYESAYKPKKP
jgi:hypothetical protein